MRLNHVCIWLTACLLLTAAGTAAQVKHNNGTMNIIINNKTFTATLANTGAAEKLKSMLPLVLKMTELNGNEKYADLPGALPADADNPGTIQAGDIMLYGSSTLVVFYKTFSTSYSYTKLAHIDEVTGLAHQVGNSSITIRFDTK